MPLPLCEGTLITLTINYSSYNHIKHLVVPYDTMKLILIIYLIALGEGSARHFDYILGWFIFIVRGDI